VARAFRFTPSESRWKGQAQVHLPARSTSAWRQLGKRVGIVLGLLLLVTLIVYFDRGAYTDHANGGELTFVDALYYATVTMTTTGYGDITPVAQHARLINTLVVTPIRIAFLVLLVGTTVEVLANEGRRALMDSQWRKTLRNHTVVVGYGTMGQSAVGTLQRSGVPVERIVVIDNNPQAVAAAKAGGRTHFITRLGADDFAKVARQTWEQAGVIPEVTEDADSHTGAAFIFLEAATGNNAIIVASGAGGRIAPSDLDANARLIGSAAVFVTQLEQPIPAARRGLEIARAAGVTTILNPAPAAPLPDGMLALCDYVTPNESEAEALTGLPVTNVAEAEAAARALIANGAGAAVITLGGQGALFCDGRQAVHVPVFSAGRVVETTGAGDAFNGGFAAALAEGMTPVEAVRFGSATAGISVTRAGTAPSMPARAEIDALLAKGS